MQPVRQTSRRNQNAPVTCDRKKMHQFSVGSMRIEKFVSAWGGIGGIGG